MPANITFTHEQIQALCQHHHVRRLLFFGSALRDDFGPESDVDVLVEFEPDARITLFDMVDLRDELAALLGRDVDLATPDGLSKYIRADVLAQAQVIYERAASVAPSAIQQ
jgi:predicted nucleotidyltransferase